MITNGFTRDSVPSSPARNELFGRCGISSTFFHKLLYKIPLPTDVFFEPPSHFDELSPVVVLSWQIPNPRLPEEGQVVVPRDRCVLLRFHFDGNLLKWLLIPLAGNPQRSDWDLRDPTLQSIVGIAGTTLKNLIVEACEGYRPRPPTWLPPDQYDTRDFYDYF